MFEHSDKNIPVGDRKTYLKMFISAVGNLDARMRWTAFFHLNPDMVPPAKNWFGFKTNNPPPHVKELKNFQNDLFKLTEKLEFKARTNNFMEVLKEDLEKIDNTEKVIVNADKTNNKYLMEPAKYKELLEKNIQAEYKKEDLANVDKVQIEHQKVVKNLGLEERIFKTTERTAFLTVKDHKEHFANDPKARLLNPTKPEIGKISKQILENVINVIREKSKLNSWKNTDAVLTWFRNLRNKKRKTFIIFDICSFYPSITLELMLKVLDWAAMYVKITQEERNIIMQSKKSFLYTEDTPWVKKGGRPFDVGMGFFDSAESCDLIGLFLLDQISNRIKEIEAGLYRDDGLAVADTTPRNVEKIRQKIVKIMEEFGLKITSCANQKIVQFLDVTLDLASESYKPYIKPGDRPLYVNKESNHPPAVVKNIPMAVNRRLSAISSSKEIFDAAAPLYQAELNRAGYDHQLEFSEVSEKRNKRQRAVIWFNPPYCMNLKTNVGQKFLRLIDKHFPKGSELYPVFNRTKMKLSYRCLPNMGARISKHNAKILQKKPEPKKCNCQNPNECPMPGKCRTDKVIYRATVTTDSENETYVGLTAGEFKTRWQKHKLDFTNPTYKDSTTLSTRVWELKTENPNFDVLKDVKFEIIGRAAPFSPVSGVCNLCILEKYEIIFNSEWASLNSRNELFATCRHKWTVLLIKKDRKKKTRARGR